MYRSHSLSQAARQGFTLLELMVAITLIAGLLLAGRTLLEQMTLAARGIATAYTATDQIADEEATAHELFHNLEVGTADSIKFTGTEQRMLFNSWCDSAAGLRGTCRVTLTVDSAVHIARSSDNEAITILPHHTSGVFRYLGDAHDGGVWYRSWGPGITAPLAVEIVFPRDTTILRIGERG